MTSIHVLRARSGQHGPELRQRVHAEQGVERANDPNPEEEPGSLELGRDIARRTQNAGANGVSDGDGKAEGDAEDVEETHPEWG
jgi:hypothetical protein